MHGVTASQLVFLAALPVTLVLLFRSVKFRLVAISLGAVRFFGQSSGLNASKLGYLLVIVLGVCLALTDASGGLARCSAFAGFTLLCISLIALIQGNSSVLVLRDASNYFFLLAAAPLAMHFGARVAERSIKRVMFAVAFVGSIAFVTEWLSRRHFALLPSLGLPSGILLALAIAASSAQALRSTHVVCWWAVVGALFACNLATGTRNTLSFLFIPVIMVVWMNRRGHRFGLRRTTHAAAMALLIVPLALLITLLSASSLSIDVGASVQRLQTVTQLTRGGASLTERAIEQDLAIKSFKASPLVGSGPGTIWTWIAPGSRTPKQAFTMDTSFVLLAKWGLIGTFAILALLWFWWRLIRPVRADPTFWDLLVVGIVPIFLISSLLASSVEDRGLPLALLLVGAGTTASRRAVKAASSTASIASATVKVQAGLI